MTIIPRLRVSVFVLTTLFSLVVLGVCAHIEFQLLHGDAHIRSGSFFALFGLGVAVLTILSLPLFLALGHYRRGAVISTILFEITWFFILWILWVVIASGREFHFPGGCGRRRQPKASQICSEITAVEVFAVFNFFCAFIYFDVVLLYAIISAMQGKAIWTASVREATTCRSGATISGVPITTSRFEMAPTVQKQDYGVYPPNALPSLSYDGCPQQDSHVQSRAQQVPPHGFSTPSYLQRAYSQAPPPGQYDAYLKQAPQSSSISPGQKQPHNFSLPLEHSYASYCSSPTASCTTPSSPPDYKSRSIDGSQTLLSSPIQHYGRKERVLSPYSPL